MLFDLDGTLVHTAPSIANAVNLMLSERGLPTWPRQTVEGWIGGGMERLVERVLAALEGRGGSVTPDDAIAGFRRHYGANLTWGSEVYPHMTALLDALRAEGHALGCVTNKPREFAAPLLAALGLDARFSALVCGDDLPTRKPDPAPVNAALQALGTTAAEGCLVGDSSADMAAARAAGCLAVLVSWGYGSNQADAVAHADARVSSVGQLQAVLLAR